MPATKPKGKPRGRSWQPLRQTVKILSIRKDRAVARFVISEDIIDELIAMHDQLWAGYIWDKDPAQRIKKLRLTIANLADMRIPAVFMRIESPTFNPIGRKLRRAGPTAKRYLVEVLAAKVRLKPGVPGKTLDWYYVPMMPGGGGIMINFDDEDFDLPPYDAPVKGKRKRRSVGVTDGSASVEVGLGKLPKSPSP